MHEILTAGWFKTSFSNTPTIINTNCLYLHFNLIDKHILIRKKAFFDLEREVCKNHSSPERDHYFPLEHSDAILCAQLLLLTLTSRI